MGLINTVKTDTGTYLVYSYNEVYLGDIICAKDGFYVFYPVLKEGPWREEVLREIADLLRSLNLSWEEEINMALEEAAQSHQLGFDFDENRVDIIGQNGNEGEHYSH